MSDNLWGKRFIQRGTKPAWHHKGFLVGDQPFTAEEMLEQAGAFDVILQPMYVRVPKGLIHPEADGALHPRTEIREADYKQIVRLPTSDDPVSRFFGAPVSKNYELIGPRQACRIWDMTIRDFCSRYTISPTLTAGRILRPIFSQSPQEALRIAESERFIPTETLGVLKQGRELFISAKIGSANIKGDGIDLYLVLDSPMYSNNAAILCVTGVRPVCANTLSLGQTNAVQKMIIPHLPGAATRVAEWLMTMLQTAPSIMTQATSDFLRMASRPVTSLPASTLLQEIYADPPIPQAHWSFGLSLEQHQHRYTVKLAHIRTVRQQIMELFGGDGFGQDTQAAKGTLFGLYNAVAEFEDNRLGTGEARALGVTVGDRSAVVRKAYRHIMTYLKN